MSNVQLGQLVLIVGALGFGAVTAYGFLTGETLAFNDWARREQDPLWFRFWMCANGVTALSCLIMFAVLALGV